MPDIWMDVNTALSEVPVNILPLLDDTDFKTRETAVAYNATGMDLVWNFVTAAGAFTQTAVTPTSGGVYDWSHQGDGIYTLEIPASGGGSINNNAVGFGWFSGVATGVLPWRGPVIGFRAAALNDLLFESAYSTTRGLAGTALPDAAAEAAGGLFTRGTGAGQINQDANGRIDANTVAAAGTTVQAASGRFQVDVELWLGSAPNALSSGRVDATVGAMQNNVMTAAAAASDLTTELQTGLATASALSAIDGKIDTIDNNVDAILIDTDTTIPNLIDGLASTLATILGHVDTEIASIISALGTLDGKADDILVDTGTDIPASISALDGKVDGVVNDIGGLNDLSAAEVNAEVVDALSTDTYGEPAGVPTATVSLAAKVGRLYQALINDLDLDASAKLFRDAAGDPLWKKALADDGTTYTEGAAEAP